MSEVLTSHDDLLNDDGPAAIVIKQWLKPVGDEIIFPPTYANPSQRKGDPPVYNIDRFTLDSGRTYSACVIDSIPSQANRIEPAFATIAEGKLVPQITVNAKTNDGEEKVSLLDAGHRAADAIVRFSNLADELRVAIKARERGDSLPLAKLAPTSFVFGMWDSRDTGVKVPRLVNSIVRAYDVLEHRRSAQYVPAIDFDAAGVGKEEELKKASTEGMADVPATFAHGGVKALGGICRDASLNLCTLRDITANDDKSTVKLKRYILGLALVAITYFDGKTLNLRQGCQLVTDTATPMTRTFVNADGSSGDFAITRERSIEYARVAAGDFGVGPDRDVTFDSKLAKAALKKKEKKEKEGDK